MGSLGVKLPKKGMFYTFTLNDFERNISLNSLSLKQILEIIEHENNPLHPISQGWKESKTIVDHPEISRICERAGRGVSEQIFTESKSLKEFIDAALNDLPF